MKSASAACRCRTSRSCTESPRAQTLPCLRGRAHRAALCLPFLSLSPLSMYEAMHNHCSLISFRSRLASPFGMHRCWRGAAAGVGLDSPPLLLSSIPSPMCVGIGLHELALSFISHLTALLLVGCCWLLLVLGLGLPSVSHPLSPFAAIFAVLPDAAGRHHRARDPTPLDNTIGARTHARTAPHGHDDAHGRCTFG